MPAALGLPPIADNLAEGFVLKPDATIAAAERPVIKRKSFELDEARFDEASPWEAEVNLAVDSLVTLASRLFNASRVASARSKLGKAAPRSVLVDEMALEVLVDLADIFPRALQAHSGADAELLRGAPSKAADEVIEAMGAR